MQGHWHAHAHLRSESLARMPGGLPVTKHLYIICTVYGHKESVYHTVTSGASCAHWRVCQGEQGALICFYGHHTNGRTSIVLLRGLVACAHAARMNRQSEGDERLLIINLLSQPRGADHAAFAHTVKAGAYASAYAPGYAPAYAPLEA
jgi:hypothetical protein